MSGAFVVNVWRWTQQDRSKRREPLAHNTASHAGRPARSAPPLWELRACDLVSRACKQHNYCSLCCWFRVFSFTWTVHACMTTSCHCYQVWQLRHWQQNWPIVGTSFGTDRKAACESYIHCLVCWVRRLFQPPSYDPFVVHECRIDRGCQLLRLYGVGGRWIA